MKPKLSPAILALLLMSTGCASGISGFSKGDSMSRAANSPSGMAISCSDGSSTLDNEFEGSGMRGCEVLGDSHYRVLVRSEDANVTNCSAWYAFRLNSPVEQNVLVELDYEQCGHRYHPKVMRAEDGRPGGADWASIPADEVKLTKNGEILQARFNVPVGPASTIVAGQELLLADDNRTWLDQLERKSTLERSLLGRSLEGAPIEKIVFGNGADAQSEELVVLGRQHPPEVTGALALMAFTERLLEDDPLAIRFRSRFTTTVIPMLNPDGVARGHWRHSSGQRDLNRDWGPFTQPETRLVRDLLREIGTDPQRTLRFFVDFHSTREDVLYTLDKSFRTDPPDFMAGWLSDYARRLPGYTVNEEPAHNADSPVAKNWVYEAFGVPTITYEIGDETDRAYIRTLGRAAAEATMSQLLGTDVPAS